MRLEFHQLDRRWEHLRVREPHRQRRLLASLAESGQQTPIVVVLFQDNSERYLVIDGHKRIGALEQLGRDTVEATVWPMSEAEALLLDRSMRFSRQETGWNKAGCCREWSNALAIRWRSWRAVSTAVPTTGEGAWPSCRFDKPDHGSANRHGCRGDWLL